MKERIINRSYQDPTASEAIWRISSRQPTLQTVERIDSARGTSAPIIPAQIVSSRFEREEITKKRLALEELNARFPGERKKRFHNRDPEYNRLRQHP